MKRFLCLLTALSVFAGNLRADEGMWLLPLIQKMNSKAMKELGCELDAKDIYNPKGSSLKDAIVQFGGGCTAEVISDRGLLLTNHHCGYGNIQKLSSVEHDYLKNGYWAMNNSEELPCEGLTVTFLEYMQDITDVMTKAEKKARKAYADSVNVDVLAANAVDKAVEALVKKAEKANPHCKVVVENFYNENVYYLIVYKVYKDIRFVGAPPSSIGKFGADTDNWMWPRHTGDFSMFRIYADAKGNPAEYSESNIPLRTRNHLKIYSHGINEGDYSMIMGYPGRTTRFQTSPELSFQIEQNDIRIAARTVRQAVLLEDMLADPAVKIQYASKYASSSNGWKKWRGMKLAFDKLDIIERAKQEEEAYQKWVDSDRKGKRQNRFGSALNEIEACVNGAREANLAFTTAFESIYRIELTWFASRFSNLVKKELKSGVDSTAALENAYKKMLPLYADYSASLDRKVAKEMLKFYREHASDSNYIKGLPEDFATIDLDAFADNLFDNSVFTDSEKLIGAITEKGFEVFQDPACAAAKSIMSVVLSTNELANELNKPLAQARQKYMEGLLEWRDGKPMYPDANFTMRLTYGQVGGYSPKDAVIYRYYTTLDGVMEKEDPNNWEFVVPEKLKELWVSKDFGKYAMADGAMPVAFLTNNDITGGNSGSPVLNANGDLIGLAFDGNWESMSSDVMFEPQLQRCINVDIRYVLFIVDKFGGAEWLIDEMDFAKKIKEKKKEKN